MSDSAIAQTNESAAPQPNLAQELVNAEGTRDLAGNTVRLLKSSSFPGSVAMQVAQAIDFLNFIHDQNDRAAKEIKKRLSKGDNGTELKAVEEPKATA